MLLLVGFWTLSGGWIHSTGSVLDFVYFYPKQGIETSLCYSYTQLQGNTWCQKRLKTSRREASEWLKSPNMTQIATDCLMPDSGHFYPIMQNWTSYVTFNKGFIHNSILKMDAYTMFNALYYHHAWGWMIQKKSFTTFCQICQSAILLQ